ncbi:MAG: DegT/DnrJ/EryC1/StrS aminotransferase family protein, partial [Patescibacteria group bacterium]
MIRLMRYTFFKEAETKRKLMAFIKDAEMLSMGRQCLIFEEQFAKKQERKHTVFVSSGSTANLALLQALLNLGRLKKGDFVGVSAITWATNVMPIIQLGLVPKMIDVELDTLNVSSIELAKKMKGLSAFFITNVLGFSSDLSAISKLCKKEKIILLEDNCESLGSRHKGKLFGNFGLASTFSFFVGHHISTIEGGMIATDDEELYRMLALVRAHGWDRNLPGAHQKKLRETHKVDPFYGQYSFYDLAYNIRPTEISGFLGQTQLAHLDTIVKIRERNFRRVHKIIEKNEKLIPLRFDHIDVVSCFAVPVIARDHSTAIRLKKDFINAEVEIRPIIAGNIAKQPFYKKYAKQELM